MALAQVCLEMLLELPGLHEEAIRPDTECFDVGHHIDVGEILLAAFDPVSAATADGVSGDFEVDDEFIDADAEPAADDTCGGSGLVERFATPHGGCGLMAQTVGRNLGKIVSALRQSERGEIQLEKTGFSETASWSDSTGGKAQPNARNGGFAPGISPTRLPYPPRPKFLLGRMDRPNTAFKQHRRARAKNQPRALPGQGGRLGLPHRLGAGRQ